MTGTELLAITTHAIGGTPDPSHDLWRSINTAGRRLTGEHAWAWRKTMADLPAVINQPYIALPADFGNSEGPPVLKGVIGTVYLVTIAKLMEMRQYTIPTFGVDQYVAFGQQDQSGVPVPVMHLYPTPTANGTPTFTLAYQRKWIDLTSGGAGGAVRIPTEFEGALISACRSKAKAIEEEDPGVDEAQYQAEVTRLWTEDPGRAIGMTVIRGDAARFANDTLGTQEAIIQTGVMPV
jgi:hypothetical protein